MNKIAITGAEGQIGSRLVSLGAEPLSCDIRDKSEVQREIHRVKPDVILHLAAMTNLEWCEEHYADALAVNVQGTAIVCEMAEKEVGEGKVAVMSSDQVFDGRKGGYEENDEPDPLNNYGMTKLGAEGVAKLYGDKIIRISRCFDSRSKDISGYMRKIRTGEKVFVPDFIIRSYCHLDFIAISLYRYGILFGGMPEILHIAGTEAHSYYRLMKEIEKSVFGVGSNLVHPRDYEEPGYAPRPYKTGLDTSLAKELGIPCYLLGSSVERLKYEKS